MIKNFESVVFLPSTNQQASLYSFPPLRDAFLDAKWRRGIFFLNSLIILQFITIPRIPDSPKSFSTIPATTESALSSFGSSDKVLRQGIYQIADRKRKKNQHDKKKKEEDETGLNNTSINAFLLSCLFRK